MSKFQDLISQIELFIKKYYKNEMVKGLVLFLSIFLFSFLVVSVLEYFGRFGNGLRTVLFYAFLLVNGAVFFKYIALPLFKLSKLTNRLTLSEASVLIGSIFPDISDKLENTLQLKSQLDSSTNVELINASIEQRSSTLSAIPFSSGISFAENKRYLKYFIPVFLMVLLIGLVNPNLFSDSSTRLINYNTTFVAPAPFTFSVISPKSTIQGEDYKLEIKLDGSVIPSEVKIKSNIGNYNLKKESKVLFSYEFKNVSEPLKFVCEADGYESENYQIDLLKKPSIEQMNIDLIYPKHTGILNEKISNIGDLTVPEGTLINWNINGNNTSSLNVLIKDTSYLLEPNQANEFKFSHKVFNELNYALVLSSVDIDNADSISHHISVIKDEYPTITIQDNFDSTNTFVHNIEGTISDDYGFASLKAHVKIERKDSTQKFKKSIEISKQLTKQIFRHQINYSDYDLGPGDRLEYYFTVTDNDEINNYKSTTSTKKIYAVPTLDSLDNLLSENNENLKNKIDQAKTDSDKINDQIKKLKNELINKNSPDWKDKQNLENLLNMQENLQKQLDQIKQDFENNKLNEEEFLNNSEELKEKQEQLEQLLNELMDEEMLELMKEMEELLKEMNKDKLIDNLEQQEMKSETMEDELDRTLELFKNMELDKKLESIEDQLKSLAEEQKQLEQDTKDKKYSDEELAKKQDEINKKFDEIQKDIQEAKDKNNELETPRDLNFDKEQEEQIDEELNNSKEQLDNGKNKKASESQQKAGEMMEQMAENVAAMQTQSQSMQQSEDMDSLRFLLENIISLSHQQEDLMLEYDITKTNDPNYLNLNREQLKISQSTEIVNDSLIALSKRVFQLSSFINDELGDLNYNLDKSLVYSEERKTTKLQQHQRYSITAYNNLALMLSEVLNQMQEQQQKMQGKGSCSKPGGTGQGSPSNQMTMEQMKQQMKDQIGKMKNGQKPGGEDGQKPGEGQKLGNTPGGSIPGLTNEQIAKMAFEQGQMKKSLQKMRQELNKDGSGNGNALNDVIKEIEKLENDLLNGNVGDNLYKRQQDIMTRLLESEKAIQERGFSEKRESNSGNNKNEGNQIDLTEYNKKKAAELEQLKSVPVGLRVYYKNLINEYFNSVNY